MMRKAQNRLTIGLVILGVGVGILASIYIPVPARV